MAGDFGVSNILRGVDWKLVTVEVTIERILPGGFGLAHAEDRTVMVALAAPGDRLRVQIERVKGNVAFASIVQIIEPSSDRVEPPCPYFGRCGGCDFQQLRYEAQLNAKIAIIKDCLHRIAKLESTPEFQIIAAPNQWHYRSRTQWQYDGEQQRLGYFEGGSRRVCDVAECAVLTPDLQQTLEYLRSAMQEGMLPSVVRDFRAVAGDQDVSIAPAKEGVRDVARTIHGETYHLNAKSFFQTNAELLPQLIDMALKDARGKQAIELYSGVGLFTLPLARRFKQVTGVEDDREAVHFARHSLKQAGLVNAEIANTSVRGWLEENLQYAAGHGALDQRQSVANCTKAAALQNVDLLLLDPPRTGAESRVIAGILQIKPKRICYVSCDPATLARDLKKLIAGGYSLDSLAAFDMFPQTHHVETVVHLSG